MTDTFLVVTSLLTALAASAAALFAGLAIRSQERSQRRQQALENFRWLNDGYEALRVKRSRAARYLQSEGGTLSDVRDVLNFLETAGFLVHHGYIDLATIEQTLGPGVVSWWSAAGSIISDGRKEYGPTIFEELEWLHGQVHVSGVAEGWLQRFLDREAAADPASAGA